jgi:hypothetical protein
MRMRLEWKVNRTSGRSASRARNILGISVSIVVLELGTINPTRYVFCILSVTVILLYSR